MKNSSAYFPRVLQGISVGLLLIASALVHAAPLKITQGVFTTAVFENKPVNQVLVVDDSVETIHFYVEGLGPIGTQLQVRWEYNDKLVKQTYYTIEQSPFSFTSTVNPKLTQKGRWNAIVLTSKNWPVKASMFDYAGQKYKELGVIILPYESVAVTEQQPVEESAPADISTDAPVVESQVAEPEKKAVELPDPPPVAVE